MDLPALWTIPFLHGNVLAARHIDTNILARSDSVLAYGRRDCMDGQRAGVRPARHGTDNWTDKVKT